MLGLGRIKKYFIVNEGFFKYNFLSALIILFCLFVPDVVVNYFSGTHILFEPLYALEFFGVLLLLSFCNRNMIIGVTILFATIELICLCFWAYFGHPITASELNNLVLEYHDVFDLTYINHTWFVPAIIFLLYGLACWIICKSAKKSIHIRWIFVVVLYLMAHKPLHALRETKGIWYFQPGPTRSSINNGINVFSYYFFQYLRKGVASSEIAYEPYQVEQTNSTTQNVLLIFGESLAASHMPMFGYERETFPQLSAILAKTENVHVGQMISPGISTATSTRLFFNSIREPGNLQELKNHKANLFKIAKQNGFKTHYISNQESRLLLDLSEQDIDVIINNDSEPLTFGRYKDEGLVKLLEKIDFSNGKNFVVLHMRSPHSPYEKRYKGREAEFEKFTPAADSKDRYEYTVNTYDNALLYTDMVISKIISTFYEIVPQTESSVYLTADHAQLFNFNGLWGHNNLVVAQGYVPFFIFNKQVKNVPATVSAFQANQIIANDLGSVIINPNEKDGTYYLHGNNIDYSYNYIEYQLDDNGNVLSETTKNTSENKKKKK